MKTHISHLIDFKQVDAILEEFNKLTGFVTAILDLDGNVLSKSGWRRICTDFHRVHPLTSYNCTISDTVLANKMVEGEKYHFYKCMNGLVDVVMPIILNNEHVANLFSGQFFFEEPDMEFFRKQAIKYSFDETQYLDLLSQVPIVSEEKVKTAMDFLHQMTQFISERSLEKAELIFAKEKLEESSANITAIIEGTADSIWAFDRDFNILYINNIFQSEFKKAFGVHLEKGSNLLESLPETIRPFYKSLYERVLNNEQFTIVDEVETAFGKLYIQITFNPIVKNNEIIGGSCFGSDITERKLLERKKDELLRQITTMIGNIEGIVYRCKNDPGWTMEYISEGCLMLTGYTADDFINNKQLSFNDIIAVEYRVKLWDEWQKVLMEHKHMVYEYPITTKSGVTKWVWEQGCGIYDEYGNIIALEGFITDITERKKVELDLITAKEKAEDSKKAYKDVVETTNDLITVVDNHGSLLFVNHSSIHFFGLLPEECIGKSAFDFVYNDDKEYTQYHFNEWINSEEDNFYFTNRTISVDNKLMSTEWNIHIERLNGEINKITSIARDITSLKEVENELIEAKNKAEENEALLNITNELTNVGGWEIKLQSSTLIWTKQVYTIHEVEVDFEPTIEKAINFYDQESIPIIQAALNGAIQTGKPFDVELKIITAKGNIKDVRALGYVKYDKNNVAEYIFGSFQDISKLKQKENQLRKLSQAVEQSPASVVITDLNGSIEYVNPKFLETTGYTQDEVIGENPRVLKSGAQSFEYYKELWNTIKSGKEWKGEFHNKKKNGELYWESARISPIKNEKGLLINFLAIKEDITDRKQAEAQLRKLSQAVEQNSASVVIMDMEGIIEYINPYYTALTGYTSYDVLGKKLRIFNIGKLPDKDYMRLIFAINSGKEWRGEYQNRKKNGEIYWEQVVISPIINEKNEASNLVAICESINERKNMELKLSNTLTQLQKFASHVQKIREEEKALLAREIHDDLGQLLVALKIDTGVTKTQFNRELTAIDLEGIKLKLSNHTDMITKAITSARRIMYGLRPVKLEMLGFAGACQEYIEDFSTRYEIECITNIDLDIEKLDEERSLAMYRILQETLMNIVKHAQATEVEINYFQVENEIIFEVKDNGVGFTVGKDGREDSYGLLGINERVLLLNGNMKIYSSPGNGTRVVVKFPLE